MTAPMLHFGDDVGGDLEGRADLDDGGRGPSHYVSSEILLSLAGCEASQADIRVQCGLRNVPLYVPYVKAMSWFSTSETV